MKIIRLENDNNEIFEKICEWNYNWWGIKNNRTMEEVKENLRHSLCIKDRMPQTFVALINKVPVGMYQISMCEDLESRPDIYPWLINVYVDEKYRGKNVARELLNTVKDNAKKIGLSEIYLYTKHVGLYEKFGWIFIEEVKTFRKESPIERLYKLELK